MIKNGLHSRQTREVKQAVRICFETETAIKTGRLNAEGAVEGALLKLIHLRESQ